MPRVPFAQDQIGEMARIKYETDELCFLRLLGDRGLVASALCKRMGLARGAIREAFAELADYRARQVVPGSIIWATRFKCFENGALLRTTCGKGGEEGNFDHLLR